MDDNQIIIDIGFDTFITQLKTLQKQYELNTAALKEMEKAGEGNSEAYIRLQQETKVLRSEISGVEKTIQNEIKAQKANEGSLVQLRAQLANLNKQYDSMDGLARMSKAGEDLQKKIKALNDQILGLEGDTGRMQRNVGNYPAAIKPVTAQLREMQQQLVQLRMEGKQNSEEYQNLAQKAGELKDAMVDAQQEVKNMASDTGNLDSVLQGAQLAAGGFSTALGIMNLFGDENSETAKELAEAQKKLQSAIAITTGLQAVQNALQKQSALMLGLNKIRLAAAAAAQKLYAAATKDAAAAQTVFNKVAKSNIYVWLVAAIVSVVGAIAAFTRGSKEQEEQTRKVNDELSAQLEIIKALRISYASFYSRATKQAQNELDLLKAQGASLDEIRKKEDELYTLRFSDVLQQKEAYKDQIENLDEYKGELKDLTTELAKSSSKQTSMYKDLKNAQAGYFIDFAKYPSLLGKTHDEQVKLLQGMYDSHVESNNALKEQITTLQENINTVEGVLQAEEDLNNEYAILLEERKNEDKGYAKEHKETYTGMVSDIRDAIAELKTLEAQPIQLETEATTDADTLPSYQELIVKRYKEMKAAAEEAEEAAKELQEANEYFAKPFTETNALEKFSEAYKKNAQSIAETSTALESSFGSLASVYQQMAQDESKSEEEREKAAKKAKAWSTLQIAANAGTAIAKGVATAVDVGFPAAIPAMATMVAAIMSAIAQAKSLVAEAHETGGVIGGKFVGATMGRDDVLMTGKRGELVLNANQQKRLFDIANGTLSPSLTAQLVSALQAMPAPVVDYQEFTRFTQRVTAFNENSKLK